jgi:GTP cyclohydrolase IA
LNKEKLEKLVRDILVEIGEDPKREGLIDTPKRIAKMWEKMFIGYSVEDSPKITLFKNGHDGVVYHDMIIDKGYFFSTCEHHMVPFFGSYYFGYIPDKWLIGASKIARTVDFFSSKLQIAERLVKEVTDYLMTTLQPKGVILIMTGRHLCKEMRGIKKVDSPFEVIAVRGCFYRNEGNCKMEFLQRIK